MTKLQRNRRPTHPGRILKVHYLEPRGVKQKFFAENIEISAKHLSNIVNGHAKLEPVVAGKIAKVLGTSTQFWLNLQTAVDAWDGEQATKSWKPKMTFPAPEQHVA